MSFLSGVESRGEPVTPIAIHVPTFVTHPTLAELISRHIAVI